MPKPHRYRIRWQKPKPTEVKLWSPIRPGVKAKTLWKVRHSVTGFYWTGRANHTKFYDQEGESWSSKEEAVAAISTLVNKASDSDFSVQRLDLRLQEIKKWEIIECKVRIATVGDSHPIDLSEYEVLNQIFKEGRTLGNVFARAIEARNSQLILGLVHLTSYANTIDAILDGMNIPEGAVIRHRTVLEVRDLKWLMMLKLALPSVKMTLNVQDIRDRVTKT